eukprot:6510700-Prymnesium_polylepis.1
MWAWAKHCPPAPQSGDGVQRLGTDLGGLLTVVAMPEPAAGHVCTYAPSHTFAFATCGTELSRHMAQH